MHLLYIDGSGSVGNANEDHFILGGVAVFERGIYHLIDKLDKIVDSFGVCDSEQVELHASDMYGGRTMPWRSLRRPDRERMMSEALAALEFGKTSTRLFGVAVHKVSIAPRDPVEYAFEEICNRFDLYLIRRFHRSGRRADDRQRGLVIMDESTYEQPLQALARHFRVKGTRWGQLRNMAEVPLFVDSKASRLIQLADLVAFAIWRKYEHQDGRFFDPIACYFDAEGGIMHGLVHYHPRGEPCFCPACMSRNTVSTRGQGTPPLTVVPKRS